MSLAREIKGDSEAEDDEYNFNWLDKEKKIYVLQNRKYVKAGHVLISALGSTGFSNPYRSTYSVEGKLAAYFSEAWGVEVFYSNYFNSTNSTLQALEQAAPNTLPSIREIRSQYGGMIHYVPWYSKINVFNSILYFDWYFGLGAASIQSFVDMRTRTSSQSVYDQQNLLGLVFSTGHQYHLSQNWVVRIDFTGTYYSAQVNGTSGDNAVYSNYTFGLGIGVRL